jgi:hypothetical protein
MVEETGDIETRLESLIGELSTETSNPRLQARVRLMLRGMPAHLIHRLAEPYRDDPGVVIPLYEELLQAHPDDARAIVILANAYWLSGRGPAVVGELATRAIAIDSTNRGAWHLWALSEPDPRQRVSRWQQVAERFPSDDLALAAVADNAAAVAGAEHDYEMLDRSIETYERLLARSSLPAQRNAVEEALRVLRGWRF